MIFIALKSNCGNDDGKDWTKKIDGQMGIGYAIAMAQQKAI